MVQCLSLVVLALGCGLAAVLAREPCPSPRGLLTAVGEGAPHFSLSVLGELLEAGEREHALDADPKSFDNLCAETSAMAYAPPFVCVTGLPVVAVQVLPQYSMQWVLDHTHPSTQLGIVFLSSVEGDVVPEMIREFGELLALHVASVTAPLPTALSQLTRLQVLDLLGVNGGPIEMPPYDLMPDLRVVTLEHVGGGTTGDWPTFENHTRLTSVSFRGAGTRNRPPDRLFQLPSLVAVDLQFNPAMFNGLLPGKMSPSIATLNLGDTGAEGSIPTTYWQLPRLERLVLAGNRLTGTISSEIGLATLLNSLWLQDNQLSGSIPSSLGRLQTLTWLDLSHNRLGGAIPSELGLCAVLEELRVDHNALYGAVPSELAALTTLTRLHIGSNHLTGPVLCLPAVELVSCADNNLAGRPPDPCRRAWTEDCDFSGLSDPQCQQRVVTCDPWGRQYSWFGQGCTHLAVLVSVPVSQVFVLVLAEFLWTFRREQGAVHFRAVGWSTAFAAVAALEFASSWTTLLATYSELPPHFGPFVCNVFVLSLLLHGAGGCVLCPVRKFLRVRAVLVVLLARQLLVEVPWRAVFASRAARGPSAVSLEDRGQGQPSRVRPSQHSGRAMLRFTRRAAFVQVVVNAAVLGWQALLFHHFGASHVTSLALFFGCASLFVSSALFAQHWHNERKFYATWH